MQHQNKLAMKEELTVEQSATLLKLGIDPIMASSSKKVYTEIDCNYRYTNNVPIFTITDLLAIIPKDIEYEYCNHAQLTIKWDDYLKFWQVDYTSLVMPYGVMSDKEVSTNNGKFLSDIYEKELIDSLYTCLVWCLKNNYVNK